jgi:NADH-quinone oxidoreductase subunit E
MGDDKDPSATISSQTASSAAPQAPVSVVPRPVSVVPRPLGGVPPTSRMPPPPSSRGILPGAAVPPGALRGTPPPAPQRLPPPLPTSSPAPPAVIGSDVVTSVVASEVVVASPASAPVVAAPPPAASSVAASPSVVPRAPATPPPPPQRHSAPPSFSRPLTLPPGPSLSAQLEQRLGATQLELRKLGSERHTLRARLRREADRLRELESALRAEKELRGQASEEHFATLIGLRTRLAEVENERDKRASVLAGQLEDARAQLQQARAELEQTRGELEQARAELEQARVRKSDVVATTPATPAPARAGKVVQGLRRIRGIGPAYQRVLEQIGVSRVQQIAGWTDPDILAFAEKLKIRPDRITKDDWVGQARALDPDSDD